MSTSSAISSSSNTGMEGTSSSAAATREVKLLNAKKKLKSYRARQSKTSNVPNSPSSSSSSNNNSNKRTSYIHGHTRQASSSISSKSPGSISPSFTTQQQQQSPSSALSSSQSSSQRSAAIAAAHNKLVHGHAHRRSHSRNQSISKLASGTNHSIEQRERDARRSSLIFARHDALAGVLNTSSSHSGTAMIPSLSSSSTSSSPANNTANATVVAPTFNSELSNSLNNSKRASRRHSRTTSISISLGSSTGPGSSGAIGGAAFDGFAAVGPSGTSSSSSPRKLSFPGVSPNTSPTNTLSAFPTSSSSPSLFPSLAAFTFKPGGASQGGSSSATSTGNIHSRSNSINKRRSVPGFNTNAAPYTLQNGRMVLSPQTSPNPPQHAFAASLSSSNGFLNPHSSSSYNKRASLGVPKSPSFFEAQQLSNSSGPSLSNSMNKPVASSSSFSSSTPATQTQSSQQHARRPSKHTRHTSVSTRRESMEIMSGLPSWNPAAFHANSPNPDQGTFSSIFASSSAGDNSYDQTVLGSSLAMSDRQPGEEEEEERKEALNKLEGRLSIKSEIIKLPGTPQWRSLMGHLNDLPEPDQEKAAAARKWEPKETNFWNSEPCDSLGDSTSASASNSATASSSFAANIHVGNKTGNLDMLVEEDEEEEEEEQYQQETQVEMEETATVGVNEATDDSIEMSRPELAEQSEASTVKPDMQEQNDEEDPHDQYAQAQPVQLEAAADASFSARLQRPSASVLQSPRDQQQFSARSITSPPLSNSSHASVKIGNGQQRVAPRPLSLVSNSSSMHNLTSPGNNSAEIKSARRQSGLRSLTLTSPEHVLSAAAGATATSPAATSSSQTSSMTRRRSSLLHSTVAPSSALSGNTNTSIRPFSISSNSSVLSPDTSVRSTFQFGNGDGNKESLLLQNGLPRPRKTFSTASAGSVASSQGVSIISTPSRIGGSSAPPTGRPAVAGTATSNSSTKYSSRRLSDLASPSSMGFGDLVMEESVAEEDEEENDMDDLENEQHSRNILDGLHRESNDDDEYEARRRDLLSPDAADSSRAESSMSNISVSEDPVIMDLQVRALKSQVEHLRGQLANAETIRKDEVDSLREELGEVREQMLQVDEEREMLREDIDGWRTRCADLERALTNERHKLDDERKESTFLREKVRKLSDRLTQQQNGSAGQGPSESENGIDASLVNAQAKLIAEMRDQIFSLAAGLERERLKSANNGNTSPRSSSPLLRALVSQDSNIARHDEQDEQDTEKMARPLHHNTSTQSSGASGSYNFSSSCSSINSQMGNGTEDTSVADDYDYYITGVKSPVSPGFWASSPTPSSFQGGANGGISIHSTSLPLRSSDMCMNYGGLQTLAEEEEEDTDEEAHMAEIEEVNAQAKKALSSSDSSDVEGEEENDAVPELVHDDMYSQRKQDFDALRARTQSTSTGSSTDTNDPMPLTPQKEHGSPALGSQPLTEQQLKAGHGKSDSFIKQWSFPKGRVEPLDLSHHQPDDSFWHLYNGVLPPLPLTASIIEAPPFSAEITLDEEYFRMATNKPLPASRPSSTISATAPPLSRSSSQAMRLREEAEQGGAASPALSQMSTTSRLSLQGITSMWGSYIRGPQTPPVSESPTTTPSYNFSSRPSLTQQKSAPSMLQPFSRKPLLRLQPSPVGRLDFSQGSPCCCDANGKSQRILRL